MSVCACVCVSVSVCVNSSLPFCFVASPVTCSSYSFCCCSSCFFLVFFWFFWMVVDGPPCSSWSLSLSATEKSVKATCFLALLLRRTFSGEFSVTASSPCSSFLAPSSSALRSSSPSLRSSSLIFAFVVCVCVAYFPFLVHSLLVRFCPKAILPFTSAGQKHFCLGLPWRIFGAGARSNVNFLNNFLVLVPFSFHPSSSPHDTPQHVSAKSERFGVMDGVCEHEHETHRSGLLKQQCSRFS